MSKPNLEVENKIIKKLGDEALIGGIDEAGRGPLAGPVVIGIVIYDNQSIKNFYKKSTLEFLSKNINDSKKISPKKREKLAWHIRSRALYSDTIIVPHSIIDNINILNATLYGFNLAYEKTKKNISNLTHLLIDGPKGINKDIDETPLINGDSKSVTIASASILAKTTRDKLMLDYHKKFPNYRFDKHKGYGTKLHYKMLEDFGPCPIHRKSFNLKIKS